MMPDNKIIALIQGIATDISAQYESIGVQSQVFVEPNIFRSTLKDGTIIDVPIVNFNNYSLEDKKKVMSLINNGLGDLYLSNDGTYKKPTMNNVINYNKPIIINSSDWIKIDDDQYSLTVIHNLNNRDVIPIVYNNSDKVETLGIQRDLNKLILESTQPIDGMVVINYSTTDTNNSMNNIATIKTEYNFLTITDRDAYFNNTPIALRNSLIIAVGTNPTQLMSWLGDSEPSTYDNTKWSNQTGLIRGERGEMGLQGIQGKVGQSVYDFAIEEQGFQGSITEYLESINSCVGKFTSFADLKVAYPNGFDKYKFAIISTVTGQVGIAFYKNSNWDLVIFASTNGSAIVKDDKSISVNSMGNIELFGYEETDIDTIPYKASDETIKYLAIEKNSLNAFSSIASKEYVNELVSNGIILQDENYNANTNTPDVATINTQGKSFAWIVNVGGNQTFGSTTIELGINDILIKTSSGGFLKIDNSNTVVTWGIIGGDITTNSSLINKLNEYAKIDDTDTTSTVKTYSNKHILELIDKHRKIFIQGDIPTENIKINDIWIDITNTPYTMSVYLSNSWIQIGSNGTTITDWVSSKEYKQGEFIIYNKLLYRCLIHNTDATFITANWVLISGHVVKGNGTYYTKRSTLEFVGNGVNITDDSVNDNTTITINADATTNTSQTFTNKNIDAVNNTISNLSTTNFASEVIDTDGTLTNNSDAKIPSVKAVKTYTDTTKIPKVTSPIVNDIAIMNSDGTISDGGISKTDLLTKTNSGMKTTEIVNCGSVNAVNSTNKTIYSTTITTSYENVHFTGWFDIFYNTQSLATHYLKIDGNIIGTMQHYANNITFCYTLPIDVVTSSIGVGSHTLSLVTTSNFAVTDSNTFKITINMFEHV